MDLFYCNYFIVTMLMFRASSMEGKHEMFWKQGDFGYVKDVKDSLITMCEPVEQV